MKRSIKSRRNKSNLGKKLVGLAAIAAIATGGITAMALYKPSVTLDRNFCTPNAAVHQAGIFVDNSIGNLTDAQRRDYQSGLERIWKKAPANTKIMVFTTATGQISSLAEPASILCKPPQTPQEYSQAGLSEKPDAYIKRQIREAEKSWAKQIKTLLSDIQNRDKAAFQSPILEQIRAISQYEGFKATSRSLTLITDGIQNSSATAMFCRDKDAMPRFADFSARHDYALTIKPDSFENTDVSVLLVEQVQFPIPEMPNCTTNELRRFWLDYFKMNGAKSVTLNPLQSWGGV